MILYFACVPFRLQIMSCFPSPRPSVPFLKYTHFPGGQISPNQTLLVTPLPFLKNTRYSTRQSLGRLTLKATHTKETQTCNQLYRPKDHRTQDRRDYNGILSEQASGSCRCAGDHDLVSNSDDNNDSILLADTPSLPFSIWRPCRRKALFESNELCFGVFRLSCCSCGLWL